MGSDPPAYKSTESISRSKTSKDGVRSLADEMLRASLTREGSSASGSSSSSSLLVLTPSASVTSTPPSYRRSAAAEASPFSARPPNPAELLARERNPYTSRRTRDTAAVRRDTPPDDDPDLDTTVYLSAADAKARVRNLLRAGKQAAAEVKVKSTEGLFKAACSTDLLFLIDTTGSMGRYITAAKEQVKSIVNEIKESFLKESEVRVAIVSYKDHSSHPNVEFLDFTPDTEQVFAFLGRLKATGGADAPEDVLGGVQQAINATWKQQTRCIIHIADAPPHGVGVLNDFGAGSDDYAVPGSEPHKLLYEPLIKQLVQLSVNYTLLRVNSSTNRMALAFAQVYTSASANAKLLPTNIYATEVNGKTPTSRTGMWSKSSTLHANLQFEEMELGVSYKDLRALVVKSVTSSVTRTAGRLTLALGDGAKTGTTGGTSKGTATDLGSIVEDDDSAATGTSSGDVRLETDKPQWDRSGWLDAHLMVEGFCPDMVIQSAASLNEMMDSDEHIKLSVAQLTIHARTKPFAEGAIRVASYARTSASSSKFVVKSFKDTSGISLSHLAEDMRIQALCKAFALEFNGLLKIEPPIDFVVTTCLQSRADVGTDSGCLSLEPYIDGEYIKYNNNSMYVREDPPGAPDQFNLIAQAFSHFTFERSWGHFLVNDLQGVGHLLTDPSIQTLSRSRFTLAATNLNADGFKFFFASHTCNAYCEQLELKSDRTMALTNSFTFRERWPALTPTVCCSSKLCRRILRLESAREHEAFKGHRWCDECFPQLEQSMVTWICMAPGPNHELKVIRFWYESQGMLPPRRCEEHTERDKSLSSAGAVGGTMWGRIKAVKKSKSISGRIW